jgi:two-component system sensor histidine kinase YesM
MSSAKKNKRQPWRSRHSFAHELYLYISPLILGFVVSMIVVVYFTFSNTIQTNFSQQTISTSEQALSNYEGYVNNVIDVSTSIQKNLENEDVKNNKDTERKYLDALMSTSKDMISVSLYDLEGNFVVGNSTYENTLSKENVLSQNWFTSAVKEPLINHFSPISGPSQSPYFTLTHLISVNNDAYGLVSKIDYNFTTIANQINYTKLGNGGHIIIYDLDYNIVYSSQESISIHEMNILKKQVIGTIQFQEAGYNLFAYLSTIQNTSWRIAIINNFDTVVILLRKLLISSIGISAIFLVVFFVVLAISTRQLTRPLIQLQLKMSQVEDLELMDQRNTEINGPTEIKSLNCSYISMMNRIHDLAQKVVQEEKEETKAQLQALQNQINPHFLYNTLDSIIYLIDENQNEKAEQMIIALGRFFRLSISRGKNIIPLENELNHVAYYLKIQKMRFGDSFNFNIKNDIKGQYYTIKLILQPIVENSLIHGFDEHLGGIDDNARIDIHAYEDENNIYFALSDNGFGMLPEKLKELQDSLKDTTTKAMGVGMRNIAQRIRLYYGSDSEMNIESTMDVGTTVHIRLPKKGCLKDDE